MPARAIGSGTLSFGLVNIPIKIYPASESGSRLPLHQLHKTCQRRLRQQLYCPVDEEVVERSEVIKGYEFAKDQYVLLTPEELQALEAEGSKAIPISEFVPLASVDPLYFEAGYYLGPDKGAERSFRLLSVALEETQHAALATFTSHGRENLELIRPLNGGLVMQPLRYQDELKNPADIPLGSAQVQPAELTLAKEFIERLAAKTFDASKYRDHHRERLQQIIDQKVAGKQVTFAPPETVPATNVVDLMQALKASLAKSGTTKAGETRRGPKRAPRQAARKRRGRSA